MTRCFLQAGLWATTWYESSFLACRTRCNDKLAEHEDFRYCTKLGSSSFGERQLTAGTKCAFELMREKLGVFPRSRISTMRNPFGLLFRIS